MPGNRRRSGLICLQHDRGLSTRIGHRHRALDLRRQIWLQQPINESAQEISDFRFRRHVLSWVFGREEICQGRINQLDLRFILAEGTQFHVNDLESRKVQNPVFRLYRGSKRQLAHPKVGLDRT